jgi:hypothetical protein
VSTGQVGVDRPGRHKATVTLAAYHGPWAHGNAPAPRPPSRVSPVTVQEPGVGKLARKAFLPSTQRPIARGALPGPRPTQCTSECVRAPRRPLGGKGARVASGKRAPPGHVDGSHKELFQHGAPSTDSPPPLNHGCARTRGGGSRTRAGTSTAAHEAPLAPQRTRRAEQRRPQGTT